MVIDYECTSSRTTVSIGNQPRPSFLDSYFPSTFQKLSRKQQPKYRSVKKQSNRIEGSFSILLLLLFVLFDHATISVTGWSLFPQILIRRVLPKRSTPVPPSSNQKNVRQLLSDGGASDPFSSASTPKIGRVNRLLRPRIRLPLSGRRERGGSSSSPEIDLNLQLQTENSFLRDTVRRLEGENQRLRQRAAGKIVLETFEGERLFRNDATTANGFDDGYYDDDYTRVPGEYGAASGGGGITLSGEEQLSSLSSSPSSVNMMGEELWCDVLDGTDQCPLEPSISFGQALRDRAYWLVGLLCFQSMSGIILSRNEALLADHPVIIFYLTMMVGAGGNAGNQASVRVIRGLALGTLNDRTRGQFLTREAKMAASLSLILSLAGFCRAIAFNTPFPEAIAVTSALALIVLSSICLGAILPLILEWLGIDPAHSSTTIQVIMDILGVLLAVVVSRAILDGPIGIFFLSRLGLS